MSLEQFLQARQAPGIVRLFELTHAGFTYYYTNHPTEIQPYGGGQVYTPKYIDFSDLEQNLALDPVQFVLTLEPLDWLNESFASRDQILLNYKMARLVSETEFTDELLMFQGEISYRAVKSSEGLFNCPFLSSKLLALQQQLLKVSVQKLCNNRLFDEFCALVKEDWRVDGTALTVSGSTVTATALGTKPDQYFYLGELVLEKAGKTYSRLIINHQTTSILLQYPILQLEAGDPIKIYPGCDKKAETCLSKFNNIMQFTGMPYLSEEEQNG